MLDCMKVIAVLNQKGGAGKTTIATNLARGLQLDGLDVVLGDADPQGTARDWAGAAEHPTVVTVGLDRARSVLNDVRRLKAEVVVIDGPPSASDATAAAIAVADLVLIPVQPSPFDIWAARAIVDLITERQIITGGQPAAAFVVNRAVAGTLLEGDVKQALEEFELPVLPTVVHQRQSYPRLAIAGRSVLDVRAERDAAAEIRSLVDDVRALLPSSVDA